MSKKILVTGGAGYIGSITSKLLLQNGYELVIADNLSRGYKQAVDVLTEYGDVDFYNINLLNKRELDSIFENHKIDGIFHFAAFCSVGESMEKPFMYLRNNTIGTLNLVEAATKNNVNKLIFSSTCATYGETKNLPVSESHPQNPTNPYGESKLMAEKIIKWVNKIHGLNYGILRYFNVCGAGIDGDLGDSKKPSPHLVQNAVRGALKIQKFKMTCPTVNTPDGTPIRDYIDVNDLAEAHLKTFRYIEKNNENLILNLGTGKGYSVEEIVSEVEKILNVTLPRDKEKTRMGEYAEIFASNKLAKEKIGWEPKIKLEDSVISLKKWYENHPEGYSY